MSKVAVVSGSNKGIGFAIVRGLCKDFNGDVYLTARNEERGKEAVQKLEAEGLQPKFHQLDITDATSVQKLHDFIKEKYGGLDILVNNAGIAYKVNSTAPFAEQAEVSVKTNFTSLVSTCDILFPILKPGARVVHLSSMCSIFALRKCSPDIQDRAMHPSSIDDIKQMIERFVKSAAEGKHKSMGFADSAYGMSKFGVSAITPLQQKAFDSDDRKDIVVNACCPGYVGTDMSSFKGHKTIDQGAETPLYLALLPPLCSAPRGNYVTEKKIQDFKP